MGSIWGLLAKGWGERLGCRFQDGEGAVEGRGAGLVLARGENPFLAMTGVRRSHGAGGHLRALPHLVHWGLQL